MSGSSRGACPCKKNPVCYNDVFHIYSVVSFPKTEIITSYRNKFARLFSMITGNNADKLSLNKKLGSVDFTLACLLDLPTSSEGQDILCSSFLLNPIHLIDLVRKFSSSILWGKSGEQSPVFSSPMTDLASVLLQDGQYEAAKVPIYLCINHFFNY